MIKYKVLCLTSGSTEPPQPDIVEREIDTMIEKGWEFVQFTSGGGGTGSGNITSWIYLIFKRDI
ncbi:MAG: hypothetical protein OIN87_08605 [Candidatus Methanoperedens sp.]|nr:hypothetical protein [Candidatus Methanoperedens sp.]